MDHDFTNSEWTSLELRLPSFKKAPVLYIVLLITLAMAIAIFFC